MTRKKAVVKKVVDPVYQPTMSTFCLYSTPGSHGYCHERAYGRGRVCECTCHTGDKAPSSEGFSTEILTLAPAPVPVEPPRERLTQLKKAFSDGILFIPSTDRTSIDNLETIHTVGINDLKGYAQADIDLTTKMLHALRTVVLEIPRQFYEYYESFGSAWGKVLKRKARNLRVELTREEFDDMRLEAQKVTRVRHSQFRVSAHATIAALDKGGRP